MSELATLFDRLVEASLAGTFAAALKQSPLFEVPVAEHPLGFRIARLASGDAGTLRLHLWRAGSKSTQPGYEVHDHAFNFRSHVLLGGFRQETYDALSAPDGEQAAYRVQYSQEGSQLLKSKRRVHLVLKSSIHVREGESYCLSHDTPHRIFPTDDLSYATLVLTQGHHSEVTTFGPCDGPGLLTFPRSRTGSSAGEEYISLLRTV